MNCKHLIGICSLTHLPCQHVVVTGKCDEAECTNAVVPTWNKLTPDERKSFPKCVKPGWAQTPCYNRLPNDRCANNCECLKTANEWGLRRDVMMSLNAIQRHLEILFKQLAADNPNHAKEEK